MQCLLVPFGLLTTAAPQPDYALLRATIEADRSRFAASYRNASDACRDSVVVQARAYLLTLIAEDLFTAWYGTPWDFNGTTSEPRKGHIACGYFVTTILQHAGFALPRYQWAQLAAEPMIRKMAPDAWRSHNAQPSLIEQRLSEGGDGLYAVGLDNHVGFILRHEGSSQFVHSGYYRPEEGVTAEPLFGENPFALSHVRVIGKLLNDDMVVKWLTGAPLGPGR